MKLLLQFNEGGVFLLSSTEAKLKFGGLHDMNVDPYFSLHNYDSGLYYQMPKIFQIDRNYINLSPMAKVCWTVLFEMQKYCLDMGWVERKSGKIYFYNIKTIIKSFVLTGSELITPEQLIIELLEYRLLETDEIEHNETNRYYLLKPIHSHSALISRQTEELDLFVNINQLVMKSRGHISNLLKEFLAENEITDEFIIKELYNEIFVQRKNEEFDIQKIESIYKNAVLLQMSKDRPVTEKDESSKRMAEAKKFMDKYLSGPVMAQLTDENVLVLYNNFDKIQLLRTKRLFNMSLVLTLKSQYRLDSKTFGTLLDKAISLYDDEETNGLHFAEFFEQVIQNQNLVNIEKILIDEIGNKLYALPNDLKNFVYNQMKKASEHYPIRYELLINNFRAINKIYQDLGGVEIPAEVFKSAFRNLFLDKEIHNIISYFKRGIEFAFNDLAKKENQDVQVEAITDETVETINDNNWLEKVVNPKDTSGDIEKLNEEEKEEYFNKALELKKRLENLRKDE